MPVLVSPFRQRRSPSSANSTHRPLDKSGVDEATVDTWPDDDEVGGGKIGVDVGGATKVEFETDDGVDDQAAAGRMLFIFIIERSFSKIGNK